MTPDCGVPVHAIGSDRSAADRAWFEGSVVGLLSDLFGTALRLTRHRADAEDLVAEAVAQAWSHLDELADRTRVRGWLFRILYAALGDASKKSAALDALRELRANSAGKNSSLMVVLSIQWYTMLGALDSAYEVASEGLPRSSTIRGTLGGLWIPDMRPFRQDPRFQALADRLGLMDYRRQYGPPDDCELRDGKLICH